MFIKPNPARVAETLATEGRDFKVRDVQHRDFLPDTGREKDDGDLHWHRMVLQGDVVELNAAELAAYKAAANPPAVAPATAPASPPITPPVPGAPQTAGAAAANRS